MNSIEWFYNEIKHIIPNNFLNKYEEAKEMHKGEILTAFNEGQEYEYQYHINNAPKFEKDYIHSHTDAIAFMSNLQHNTLYEVLDLATNLWIKQNYTFLVDNNEQEKTQNMIHAFRMGWIKKLKT